MEIKHKIWLERNGEVVFGQGRESLLKAIEEYRSLNIAAKKLNMSYRAAWGRLKASEKRLGMKLVEHKAGEPLHLTENAKTFLREYERLEKRIDTVIKEVSRKFKLTGEGAFLFFDEEDDKFKLTSIAATNLVITLASCCDFLI